MVSAMTVIRSAGLADLPGAYRACLQTADAGRDGTAIYQNPDLLGHVYVGPYIVGQPQLSFVIADDQGVAGYVLGAADTRSFEAWEEKHWWPTLREHLPLRDGDSEDEQLIRQLHLPVLAPELVVTDFPAHLHIDLLPRVQGRGFGRHMLDTLFRQLRDEGVAGVHLDVGEDNHNAIAFYEHLGFATVGRGESSFYMGMPL